LQLLVVQLLQLWGHVRVESSGAKVGILELLEEPGAETAERTRLVRHLNQGLEIFGKSLTSEVEHSLWFILSNWGRFHRDWQL